MSKDLHPATDTPGQQSTIAGDSWMSLGVSLLIGFHFASLGWLGMAGNHGSSNRIYICGAHLYCILMPVKLCEPL